MTSKPRGPLKLRVMGIAQPQGNHRVGRNARIYDANKQLPSWRNAVQLEYRRSVCGWSTPENPALIGAVELEVVFHMPKPRSGTKRILPSVKPDLDKILRSTMDALTKVGAWEDDSRVVSISARKVYMGMEPGAVIEIRQVAELEARWK